MPEKSTKSQQGLEKLKKQYAKLLGNQRMKMQSNESYALQVMQSRIEDMFKLLSLWQQYVEIIYAPENEINMLKNMKDSSIYSGVHDDANFASKMEN